MRTLCLALVLVAFAHAGSALAAEDIVRTNGAVATTAGGKYDRLATTNGSIRLADGVTAGPASTVNGSITAGNDVTGERLSTVNGSIRIGERARISGSVETVNGSVLIDRGSRIGGDVGNVNGAMGLIATEVLGDIEMSNGDLTVGIGSHVHGGVRVRKAGSNWMPIRVSTRRQRVIIGPGAVVEGPLAFEREVVLYVHDTARIGEVTGAEPVRYSTPTAPPRGED
ncbi:hypothetical protein [Luteimonas terricola]|uniref:hypothetical protein n=1 Tax=Luteimonas terricola TaxID=645597 RepID=UPI0014053F47